MTPWITIKEPAHICVKNYNYICVCIRTPKTAR